MPISNERLDYIKLKINTLRKRLQITKYSIVMEDLILQEFSNKCLLRYLEFSDTADAVSEYHPKSKICVIVVNIRKTKQNLQKRLKFSLAHELVHYILEHHKFYRDYSTVEEIEEYEEEANEFAGLLLVDEYKLREHKKAKNAHLSDYFFVSKEVVRIRKSRISIHSKHY